MNPLDAFPAEKLSKAEEAKLAQGTSAQLEKLVLHTMREAVIYARHISHNLIPDDELISICYDVLYRGAKRWKAGWARFFPFCKAGVRGYTRRSWRQKDTMQIPLDEKAEGAFAHISAHFPISPQRNNPKAWQHSQEMSPWDMEEQVTPEHEIQEMDFDPIYFRERWAHVEGVIKKVCNEREQAVLSLTYQSGLNFQEIAKMLDLTRSAIQRTHRIALRKIRVELMDQKRLLE